MRLEVHHSCTDFDGYRAARVKSLFNVESGHNFDVCADLPIEDLSWTIGVIVGPSGSGKSSLGAKIFGPSALWQPDDWRENSPLVEALAPHRQFDDVTGALSAVGLGSVPSWLRPYKVLSTGEKFRADLARLVLDAPAKAVVDEFTSVVDRQIAKVGAHAFSKAWRRTGGQAVLLSCHYDILDWIEPDWVFDTAAGTFSARARRRPKFNLEIYQTNWQFWPLFEPHHYLKLPHMIAAKCYVGFVDETPVAHLAVSTRPGLAEARACRLVVMPEWQGAGVGMRFLNAICAAWRRGNNPYNLPLPTLFHTSHPALAAALRRDPKWTQISANLSGGNSKPFRDKDGSLKGKHGGHFRAVQGFRYLEDL